MSLFHSIRFNFLRNVEVFNLSHGLKNLTDNYTDETLMLVPFINKHNNAHQLLDNAMNHAGTSVLTEDIAAANDDLDEAFVGFRNYVEAFTHRQDPNLQLAGRNLVNLIRSYGYTLQNKSYTEEQGLHVNLIADLENNPDRVADVNLLSAEDFLAEYKTSFTAFTDKIQERNEAKQQQPDLSASEARGNVRIAINDLIDFVDLMHKTNPRAEYEQLAASFNEIIDTIMTVARSRKTREG